jgi:ubiquinone biosynthesis protein COQ9
MTDPIRDRILAEALPDVAVNGFTEQVLAAAAERAGVEKRDLLNSFPHGAASLVEAFSHWADARMTDRMQGELPERLRERVTAALRARIEVMAPYKEAARRAAAFLSSPLQAALAARLMVRTVDAIWRAAGDASSDFSYYTKRASLSGVYGATLLYWLSDSSGDNQATWAFLGRRIEDVMRIEKWRGQAREAISKLPDPFKILGDLAGPRR